MVKQRLVCFAAAVALVALTGASPAVAADGVRVLITASDGWAWNATSDDPSPSSFNCAVAGTSADRIMKAAQVVSPSTGRKLSSGKFKWIVDPTVPISLNPLYPAQSGKYLAHCAVAANVEVPARKTVNIVLLAGDGSKKWTIRSVTRPAGTLHITYDKITGASGSAGRI